MLRRALLAVSFLCLAAAAQADKPRLFPDTRDRIVIFEDQLPSSMTDAQVRFAATHYAGSQKMSRTWTRRLRALNPNFLMLHYQLAVGAGPAAFMAGDRWVNDYAEVTRHEDWFLHDAPGHRLHQTDWNWDVMDIGFDASGKPKTGFPAFWVQTAIQRMRATEDDGCFADSYTQDILMGQTRPSAPIFADPAVTKRDWLPSLNQYGAYCARAFHAQPEQFKYLPNLGGLVTTWDKTTNLLVGDGGMNEGFCASGSDFYSDDDWRLQMSRILSLAVRDKIVLCQTSVNHRDADRHWFVVGAYLLTKGRHSYLNMMDKGTLEWYPEYGLNLGGFKDEAKSDLAAYWDKDWKVYRRDYVRGMVLVNPSASPVTVSNLGASYRLVMATGGGAISADGQPSGALTTQPTTSVTIPAHSARVMLLGGHEKN